eukprot:1002428-Amphidinium_carterae.1
MVVPGCYYQHAASFCGGLWMHRHRVLLWTFGTVTMGGFIHPDSTVRSTESCRQFNAMTAGL